MWIRTVLVIGEKQGVLDLEGIVHITSILEGKLDFTQRQHADKLAEIIGEKMGYLFRYVLFSCINLCLLMYTRYHSVYKYQAHESTQFTFHCAQNRQWQHTTKKVSDKEKQRDWLSMSGFDCEGWLQITFGSNSRHADIKIQHSDDHVPYCTISLPEEIKALIDERRSETMTQVRHAVNIQILNIS